MSLEDVLECVKENSLGHYVHKEGQYHYDTSNKYPIVKSMAYAINGMPQKDEPSMPFVASEYY